MSLSISPLNTVAFYVEGIVEFNATTGVEDAITTGTVTGFLATSDAADATTADATLSVSGVHVGGQTKPASVGSGTWGNGTWMFRFLGSALTLSLLDTHFLTATPHLIVTRTGTIRAKVRLTYNRRTLEATVEP